MKKTLFLFLLTLFLSTAAFADATINPFTGNLQLCTTFEESDGTPSILCPDKVKVSNASLTDNGDGTVTLSTGAPSIGGTIGGGTVGSVLFVGAGPVIQQDNPNFFWDDTNNRLGLGTTAPAAKLHVVGDVRIANASQINHWEFQVETPNDDDVLLLKSKLRAVPSFRLLQDNLVADIVQFELNPNSTYSFLITGGSGANRTEYSFVAGGDNGGTGVVMNAQPNEYVRFRVGDIDRVSVNELGNVGIGTNTPNAAAILELFSTTKGFLPSRMTTIQRDAILTPPAGLMVYNTTTNKLNFYNGTAWEAVTSA